MVLPSLLRNSPGVLQINCRRVNIGAVELSKLLRRLRGRLPMRVEVASKKAKGPSHNPALRPPLVRLQVKPAAESRKAREPTRNPAALQAGDRPLVVGKRNRRAERKKASKVLQLPLALNDVNLNLGIDNGPGVIRDRLAYMDCSSGNRVGCETRWLASDRGRHARF